MRLKLAQLRLLLAVIVFTQTTTSSDAQTGYSWQGGTGNFNSTNWQSDTEPPDNGPPGSRDSATVGSNGGTVDVVIVNSSVSLSNVTFPQSTLNIHTEGPALATFQVQSGGTFNVDNTIIAGPGSRLQVQDGGIFISPVSFHAATNSVLTVDHGGSLSFTNGYFSDGASIQGTGTVSGFTYIGDGTIRVGDGATAGETLTMSKVISTSLSTLHVGVKGTGGAGNSGVLNFNTGNPLSMTGGLNVKLTNDGLIYGSPGTWTFITSSEQISGITEANFNFQAIGFNFASTPIVLIGTNSVSVSFTPVPEPTTLLAFSAVAILGVRAVCRRYTTQT